MNYYINKTVIGSFDAVIEKVTSELKKEGFGVLTDIDVRETLKKKLDVDFRKYRILGACNPPFAYQAFQAEERIGILLPCNVIVFEKDDQSVEVAAVNPLVAMQAVNNAAVGEIAAKITAMLQRVIDNM